ncbi:chitin synthase, partial [Sphaeroforma arctica JP610]
MQIWYRAVQSYDYEASISSFLGSFSFMGMLPVIPSPAGLWRMSDCGGAPMDHYINDINNISAEDGLIKGNLLLAEDRILSYTVCLMTGKYTRWVPMAVFYTEAETDIKSFITQRRWWINGTIACYLFLLFTSP